MKDYRIGRIYDANKATYERMLTEFMRGNALRFDWCGGSESVVLFLQDIGIKDANVYYNDSKGWAEVLVTRKKE